MKKIFKKLLAFSIIASTLITCSACVDNKPDDGGEQTGGVGNVLMGGERPNYDEMFDYESGYIKPDFDPNKVVTLTIDADSPVKFKDGTKTISRKVNTKLTIDDFDLSGVSSSRTFMGLSTKDNRGYFINANDLENYAVPYNDSTILPYFDVEEGYDWVNVGSGTGNKYNGASLSGSFKTSSSLSYIDDSVIKGGTDSAPQRGGIISETGSITIDSAFRLDSTYTVVANTVYEFKYNFSNMGDNPVSFNLYQVSSGSEYGSGSLAYTSRYRIDVDLEPGESASYKGQYKLGSNGNFLTYMVADSSMRDIRLGISMSAKATTLTEPDNPAVITTSTLSLSEDSGMTFAGGSTSVKLNENDALPKVNYTITDPNIELAGWYNVDNPAQIWSELSYELRDVAAKGVAVEKFAMPSRNTTIAPFFANKTTRQLIAGSRSGIDYNGTGTTVTRTTTTITTAIGKQVGTEFTIKSPAYDGTGSPALGTFRFVTSCAESATASGALKAGTHTFNFTFVNLGEETIKFSAHQVVSYANVIEGVESGVIELKSGESWSGSMTVTLTGANNNALTIIRLLQAQTNAKLGVVMTKNP